MLVVVMHNNRDYLGALGELIRKEGIFNSTIIEEKNIGTRLIGDSVSFIPQTGVLRPAYDKALVAVVRGEEQLKCIMKIIKEDERLSALNMADRGFVCTMPFSQLRSMAFEAVQLEKNPELDVRVCNLLKEENIVLDLKQRDRDGAIREIAGTLKGSDEISDLDVFIEKVLERESLNTTGIGDEVAIPHARTDAVKKLVVAFGRSSAGVEFRSLDGKPAKLIFLIGSPPGDEEVKYYLKILARLAKLLRNQVFRDALIHASTPGEIVDCFKRSAETVK